jgi:acetyltransferase-like isoleucine patch superfamily enzyme
MTGSNIFFDLSDLKSLGADSIIGKTVRIRKPALCSIGRRSILDDFTYISCGITVGDYTHIGANGVLIGGDAHITIGHFVNIAPGCRLIAASNDFTGGGLAGPTIPPEFSTPSIISNITLGDHVLLGTGTVILPGVHMPEGVSTGAMTLIPSGMALSPWTLYVGIPARPVRQRDSAQILEAAIRLRTSEKQIIHE